ncbi:MAG TPA: hypothetical protein VF532_15450 [Candidatus Angelobacter sp.]
MFHSLRPGRQPERLSLPTALRNGGLYCRQLLLLVLFSLTALAQTELKEPAGQSDVRAAIRELIRTEQSQAAAQSPVAAQDPGQNQLPVRIIPFGRRSGSGIKSQAPLGAHLTYWGGPVISNVQVVAVFWGPNVVSAVTANGAIDQFYTDITSSRYFDELTEYTTAGITGANGTSTSNQTIGHGTFGGKFTITPSVCPGPAACTVTDAQIQTELTSQINSHVLPAPQTDAHGIINTYYAIYFPPNVTISIDPTIKSCVSGGFCAYHSNTGSLVPYGVLPDVSTGGCSLGCGSGTTFQIATGVSSHEMAEAITDPQVGSASVFGPPLGWYDNPPNLGEIADLCDPFTVAVNAGATTYTVEMLFSNVQNDCAAGPPNFSMPSPAGGAGPNVPFNMTLTIRANEPAVITPLNYLATVHFTSSDAGAVLPADYTFTAGDGGVHIFPFTLTVLGNQTITVTDTRSSGFTGTTTVNVNTVPDMTLTLHHVGNFGQGQVGAYTIVASNFGGGPTSGTVTVVDTLPTGMTAAAMSGTGWSCTVATATCTRADVLAAGGSYPPITLTVNVSNIISSSVTNTATVSGGGETITSDNFVGDVTTVVSAGIDLTSAIDPFQIFTTQGATGVAFTATVGNFGSVGTSGTVTLVATLGQGITAKTISGTGWNCALANLTCTRNDVLGSALSYPGVTITFDVPLNAPLITSSVSVTVSGSGTDTSTANNTATTTVSIGSALAIFSNTPSVTVAAGTPARFQVGVNATAAAGTVIFGCSGLPALSSCSFSPATLNSTSTQVIMTVTTTAKSAVVNTPGPGNHNPWLWPEMLLLAAIAGWSLRLVATPGRRRRLVPVLAACTLVIAGILAGCGGGGGSTTTTVVNTNPGTPAGTYAITFTATSTNAGATSRTMTLIVQ